MTLLLGRTDLEGLVDAPSAIRAIESTLRDIALGKAFQPAPFTIPTGADDAKYVVMAAYDGTTQLAASKLLADVPDNAVRGLPVQRSLIVLSSRADGAVVAVLDGRVPTRERTAATTAVATRALSRPESDVLGFIGTGALAEPHLRAIRLVRPIRSVLAWSRTDETAQRFAAIARSTGVAVEVVGEPAEVAARADIICTLTPSRLPVLAGEWLPPGVHVNAVGAPPRPDHRELDTRAVTRSTIFVDDLAASIHESGDVVIPMQEGAITPDSLVATIGDVLAGLHPGRVDADEITLFNSVGMGAEDLAIAAVYVDEAVRAGVGREFAFSA